MSNPEPLLPPGFRFHPTDEELILHYLKNRASSTPCPVSIIAEIDIYKFDPWDLPAKAVFGDKEWYFFTPRDRKYPNGVRPNRAARSGYWKATGTDKPITTCGEKGSIGVKKALVFYIGKPPRGTKTDWIMHEYRLAESVNKSHHHMPIRHGEASMRLDDWVLCRIYKKSQNHNADIPTVEPEREDSNVETTYFPGLSKAGSLSELLADVDYSSLSRLLYDNPHDLSRQEQLDHMLEYPSVDHQSGFHANSLNSSTTMPGLVGVKRDRDDYAVETAGSVMNPTKKLNTSCTPTNLNYQMGIDTAQYSSNYFNHQLLLDPHLGLH